MRKKKVLIVEDEESLLKLGTLLLTSRGYEVKGVTDGQAALDLIGSLQPDLVLLDIMLPKVNGFEVCRQIKTDVATKDIPVVMVTAKKSRDDMIKGEQVGADWYITKPYRSEILLETVRKLLFDVKPAASMS